MDNKTLNKIEELVDLLIEKKFHTMSDYHDKWEIQENIEKVRNELIKS